MDTWDVHVQCSAPTRADLAGGTLDVKPVAEILQSLAETSGERLPVQTLNVALDLRARCELKALRRQLEATPRTRRLLLHIEGAQSASGDPFDLSEQPGRARLRNEHPLIARCVLSYAEKLGNAFESVSVKLSSSVPRGSGLGGSSALVVTLLAALERLLNPSYKPGRDTLCEMACDLEAGLLGSLAGIQDHLGAAYGGIHAFSRRPGGLVADDLGSAALDWLAAHGLLALTSGEHHSGTTNWTVLRALMEGNPQATEAFLGLARNANETRMALESGDHAAFCTGLSRDWSIRKGAFPGLSTPAIDRLEQAAQAAGADGFKVCGAAAGGVALLVTKDYSRRDALAKAVQNSGAETLALQPSADGLRFED